MADTYKVFDKDGKVLTGKSAVDRETARKAFDEAQRAAGPGEGPTMTKVGQDKAGPKEAE